MMPTAQAAAEASPQLAREIYWRRGSRGPAPHGLCPAGTTGDGEGGGGCGGAIGAR
jgi:hypothetical protein